VTIHSRRDGLNYRAHIVEIKGIIGDRLSRRQVL
jgi:hypothetical protein